MLSKLPLIGFVKRAYNLPQLFLLFTLSSNGRDSYRFSKLFQLTDGYRVLSVAYNKGTGDDRFLYDIDTFGPVIRFGFIF